MSDTKLRNVLEEIKNRAESIQAYGIRDLARQALSNAVVIGWIKYDRSTREIESHVNHLVTNGHRVLIAQHASVPGTGQYSWMINNTLIDWVTHYAKINLPTKTD